MPIRPDLRRHYETPAWRALSRRIRKERAGDRCECTGECGTDHAGERAALLREGRGRSVRGGGPAMKNAPSHGPASDVMIASRLQLLELALAHYGAAGAAAAVAAAEQFAAFVGAEEMLLQASTPQQPPGEAPEVSPASVPDDDCPQMPPSWSSQRSRNWTPEMREAARQRARDRHARGIHGGRPKKSVATEEVPPPAPTPGETAPIKTLPPRGAAPAEQDGPKPLKIGPVNRDAAKASDGSTLKAVPERNGPIRFEDDPRAHRDAGTGRSIFGGIR